MFKKLSTLLAIMLFAFALFAVTSCSDDKDVDLSSIEKKIDDLEKKITAYELEQKIAELKTQLSDISDVASIAATNETDLSALELQLANLQQQLVDLEQQLATAASSSEADLSELQNKIVALEEQLNEINEANGLGTRFSPEMHGLTPGKTVSELNINWWSTNTNHTAGAQALVRLYTDDGTLVNTYEGIAAGANPVNGTRHHKVTLIGLTADTKYKYSVSNNGTDWSHTYDYKTPSSTGFKFAAVADVQIADGDGQDATTRVPGATKLFPYTTSNGWIRTAERIAAAGASFIVSAGDQVDPTAYTKHTYEKFFAPSQMRSIPLAPSLGNHDTHCEFFMHYNMPNLYPAAKNPPQLACSGSGTSLTASTTAGTPGLGNYYYLYNNILFVALNTAPYPNSKDKAEEFVTEFSATIDAAKTAHSGKYTWLIVQHHKSTQSLADHPSDTDIDYYIQAGFEKMMTDKGVDLVIAGHDHVYVRSQLLKWDADKTYTCGFDGDGNTSNPTSHDCKGVSVPSDDKGTVYLTLNTGSGLKYYDAFSPTITSTTVGGPIPVRSEAVPVLVDLTSGRFALREALELDMPKTSAISALTAEQKEKMPIGTAFYSQEYKLSYTIFEVNGASMTVTTHTTADNALVETFTITPKGR